MDENVIRKSYLYRNVLGRVIGAMLMLIKSKMAILENMRYNHGISMKQGKYCLYYIIGMKLEMKNCHGITNRDVNQ